MSNFKVGDRVKMNPKSGHYGQGDNNPKNVVGIISSFLGESETYKYKVTWANGSRNQYRDEDLISNDSTIEFKPGDLVIMRRKPTADDWLGIGTVGIPGTFFTEHQEVLDVDYHESGKKWSLSLFNKFDNSQFHYPANCFELVTVKDTNKEDRLIAEAKIRYPTGTIFFSAESGHSAEAFHNYEYDESADKLCDDGWAVYYKGKWAELDGSDNGYKFNVGDRIIGNAYAREKYDITTEGWKGYVYRTGSVISVGDKIDPKKCDSPFTVDPACFDRYLIKEESLISSTIKTSENGKAKHDDSERVIKVSQPDFEVSRGNQIRGSRINSSTSEVSIGNRHRHYEARSIRG